VLLRGDGVCVCVCVCKKKKERWSRDIEEEIKQLCSCRKVILKIPYEEIHEFLQQFLREVFSLSN
jgi:hypothetical protein